MSNYPAYEQRTAEALFSGLTATTTGTPVYVGNYRHIIIEIIGSGTASGVIKVLSAYGSEDYKNFSPQHCRNIDTDASVTGTAGLTISANGTYKLLINTDYIDWLRVDLTRTTGTFSANLYAKGG